MNSVTAISAAMLVLAVITVNGQITTPCTVSQIASFAPCLSYIIGSSSNGRSPTASCCKSLESLVTTSMDCTCLIVTGNIPFSLPSPISQALAISLPNACKTNSLPIQCKATGVSLPPAGPALFVPPPPKRPPPRVLPPQVLPPIADSPNSPPSFSGSETSAPAPTPSEMTPDEVPDSREEPDASASAPIVRQSPRADSGIRPVLTPASVSNVVTISPTVVLLMLVTITMSNFHEVFCII